MCVAFCKLTALKCNKIISHNMNLQIIKLTMNQLRLGIAGAYCCSINYDFLPIITNTTIHAWDMLHSFNMLQHASSMLPFILHAHDYCMRSFSDGKLTIRC